ncbi:conserved hypothetical protein [uncultured Spirochaetota bacterium]|nr:conserved hypothetical protein [uncultured Spirochaetota bacterium]
MKSKGVFYIIRRRLQVFVYKLTSSEFVSKIYFRIILGYKLNLKLPQTFNEKIQWLKLYYLPQNKKVIQCSDKYLVRKYIEDAGEGEILNDLLFVWNSASEINWDKLPNQFVLKCNHGCGYNIICSNKSNINETVVKNQINKWMREDFGQFNAEPHYDKIDKKIVCERFLGADVINYNIYVLNGKVVFFSVAGGLGNAVGEHLTYYYADGGLAFFKNKNYPTRHEKLSGLLSRMKQIAEHLAKGFPMVRVDFFDVRGKIIFSEMTFTPGGALIPFDSYKADKWLGNQLDISQLYS